MKQSDLFEMRLERLCAMRRVRAPHFILAAEAHLLFRAAHGNSDLRAAAWLVRHWLVFRATYYAETVADHFRALPIMWRERCGVGRARRIMFERDLEDLQ